MTVARGKNRSGRIMRYKTVLCRNIIEKGVCPYGDKCVFVHSTAEQRSLDDAVRSALYKTTLCRNMLEHGVCPYGDSCTFIHEPVSPKARPVNEIAEFAPHEAQTCAFDVDAFACGEGAPRVDAGFRSAVRALARKSETA